MPELMEVIASGKGKHISASSTNSSTVDRHTRLIRKIMFAGAAHNGQVCSTWGNFHYYTFDGDFFQLPYGCNYVLTTMCDSTQSDFNIQMRREYIDDLPEITSFTIKLEGVVITLQHGKISVNDKP